MDKVLSVFQKIVVIICAIIILYLCFSSIIFTAKFINPDSFTFNEMIKYFDDNVIVNICLVSLLIIALAFLSKLSKNKKYVIYFIVVIHGILGILWAFYAKFPIKSDQKFIDLIANQFLQNNFFALERGAYLYYYPHQLGIVVYIFLVYKIFASTNVLIPMVLNAIYSMIILLFVYKITKLIFKDDIANNLIWFISGFFIFDLRSTFIYGNIIGLMFAIIAIYNLFKFMQDNKKINIVIAIFSMVLAITLKLNYLIFFIAFSMTFVMYEIKNKNGKMLLNACLIILLIFAMFKFLDFGMKSIIEKKSGKEFSRGVPSALYISMAMAEKESRPSGWFNNQYNGVINIPKNNYDLEKTKNEAEQDIKDRLEYYRNNPIDCIEYYEDKILSTWIEPTFQTIWDNSSMEETNEDVKQYVESHVILNGLLNGNLKNGVEKYFDIYAITVYLLSFIGLMANFKKMTIEQFTLILIFFGGFTFHILWETKSLYVIPYFVMLLPLAANGLESIKKFFNYENIKKHISKINKPESSLTKQ